MLKKSTIYIAITLVCVGTPLLVEWSSTSPPSERKVHIEAFRYGTKPSIIRVNRGDRLTLTFSTRDTGHSFFLQDYRIDAKISPASKLVEVRDPLRATEPPVDAPEVRLRAGMPGLWGRLVSVSRFRCHVYCGPMHAFEQGDLIVRPNWLLSGSLGVLLSILIIGSLRVRWKSSSKGAKPLPPLDLNHQFRLLDRLLKWRPLQFVTTLPILAGFVLVVFAGLFGTKVSGRNIATMMTWVAWMSMLTLILVPLGGRIWCMMCPLPIFGEYLQRGATVQVRAGQRNRFRNRFFGLGLRWPRFLRGPWLRLCLFLGLGTISASLAGQPRWTAVTLLCMALVPVGMSVVWELRAFCRYVCPIASYISSYSAAARLMVRNRKAGVCAKCKQMPCLTGNAEGWACPYGISVAAMKRNVDCGLCTECFKSCPYDNVSLAWRRGPWNDRFSSYGEVWQATVLLVLALLYTLTVHSPWPAIRDIVNIVDKANWVTFGLYALVVWVLALGIVPLFFWLTTALGLRLINGGEKTDNPTGKDSGLLRQQLFTREVGQAFKATMPCIIPIGIALWASFFIATIMVNFTFFLMTLSDPFGWGWNLLGIAGMPWIQIWPSGIPWIQTVLVLAGFTMTLKKGHEQWSHFMGKEKKALKAFVPTAVILTALAAGMLVYFTNY